MLTPPAPPSPAVTQIAWTVPSSEDGLLSQGYELGVKQRGNFLGFSIELSVADQISTCLPLQSYSYERCHSNFEICISGQKPGQLESPILKLPCKYPEPCWNGASGPSGWELAGSLVTVYPRFRRKRHYSESQSGWCELHVHDTNLTVAEGLLLVLSRPSHPRLTTLRTYFI